MLARCSAALLSLATLFSVLSLSPHEAHAQAQSTASKTLGLSAFATATREVGFAVGGDITRYFRLLDISFEARYPSATGFSADESTYGGGFKFERAFNRFHPYVDVMVASGNIKFDHPEIYGSSDYTHDNSFVYDAGGGLDYDLIRHFAVKLDVQGERWKIGTEKPPFYPYNASVGLLYRIPFRDLRRR